MGKKKRKRQRDREKETYRERERYIEKGGEGEWACILTFKM